MFRAARELLGLLFAAGLVALPAGLILGDQLVGVWAWMDAPPWRLLVMGVIWLLMFLWFVNGGRRGP